VANYDYSTSIAAPRLLSLDYNEQPYSKEAEITLNNYDASIPNLTACYLDLGLGDVTSAGNEYVTYPRVWVVSQYETSYPGVKSTTIKLWGAWNFLGAKPVDSVGVAPNHDYIYDKSATPLAIMQAMFTANGITLTDTSDDDGITNTFLPYFEVNIPPHENYLGVIYRPLMMTKKYIRMNASMAASLVFPQDADAVDETYYSTTTSGYMTALNYREQINRLVPNRVIAYCNHTTGKPWNEGWEAMITGTATGAAYDPTVMGQAYITEYLYDVPIDDQTDANNYCAARLIKFKAQLKAAAFTIPHDARLQPYDKARVMVFN